MSGQISVFESCKTGKFEQRQCRSYKGSGREVDGLEMEGLWGVAWEFRRN